MRNIIEIKIANKGVTQKKQWEAITRLYDEVLNQDKNWHFFYEVFFNIVRVSKKNVPAVKAILDEMGIFYEDVGPWIDNQEITKKHQKHFKAIFHEQSELILKTSKITDDSKLMDEIWFLADRMIHCFLNNNHYIAGPWKRAARLSASWENYMMYRMAHSRTSYNAEFAGNCERHEDFSWADYAADVITFKPKAKYKPVNPLKATTKKEETA